MWPGIPGWHFVETDLAAGFTRSQIKAMLKEVEDMAGQEFDTEVRQISGGFSGSPC